jgi:cellulose synthase operon protein B
MFRFQRRSPNPNSQPPRNRTRIRLKRLAFALLFAGAVGLTSTGLVPMFMQAQAEDEAPLQLIRRSFDLPTIQEPMIFKPKLAASLTLAQAANSSPTASPSPAAAPAPAAGQAPTAGQSKPAETEAKPAVDPAAPKTTGTIPANVTSSTTGGKPTYQHVWEFSRTEDTGNRLRLQGVYPSTRVKFTRPRNWRVQGAKVQLRFQHSNSLDPTRSNVTLRLNDTSIGSVPLSSTQGQVSEMVFNIPPNLLQENNDLAVLAEQHTLDACSNPSDPTLWTEVLPDSKVIMDFVPQQVALDFSRYPFPFIDDLNLENNELTYLRPKALTADWLTATSRFHTDAARRLGNKPLDTKLVNLATGLDSGDRLIVIGTPMEQPILTDLNLPFSLQGGKFLDGKKKPLPDDVGLLMLTVTKDSNVPTLVATGNSPEGVAKAVQFLVQSKDTDLGTGRALTISNITEVPIAEARAWKGFMPVENSFDLSALTTTGGESYQDTTVRGTSAPPIHLNFRALPDDRFMPGSSMTLRYSHSPVNSRLSTVEVRVNDVTIASKRLDSNGGDNTTFTFRIPEDRIQISPQSQLDVHFIMKPEQGAECGVEADQQLWATLHSNTRFDLKRDNVVTVPDLKLFQVGYPFNEPQDLSSAAIALPANPNDSDIAVLMSLSEMLGRNSSADAVRHKVFLGTVPDDVKGKANIVEIGTRDRLPLPEVFEDKKGSGFSLSGNSTREWEQSQVQAPQDNQGVIKAVLSPWNKDKQLMALTGSTDQGLKEVQSTLENQPLLAQIQGDTVLINSNKPNPKASDPEAYTVKHFQQAEQRRIAKTDVVGQIVLFLQDNWFMVPAGIAFVALPLYGFSQLYLNRVDR